MLNHFAELCHHRFHDNGRELSTDSRAVVADDLICLPQRNKSHATAGVARLSPNSMTDGTLSTGSLDYMVRFLRRFTIFFNIPGPWYCCFWVALSSVRNPSLGEVYGRLREELPTGPMHASRSMQHLQTCTREGGLSRV